MKLYYAEDDSDDLEFFNEALASVQQQLSVVNLSDGHQLMEILHGDDQLPDVIFLDINLPLKNGYECIDEIKSDPKLKHLPVVIFSTSSSPDIIELMLRKGASGYIVKPVNFNDWRGVIERALGIIGAGRPAADLRFAIP